MFGGKVISCKLLNLLQETSLVTLGIRSNLQMCLLILKKKGKEEGEKEEENRKK